MHTCNMQGHIYFSKKGPRINVVLGLFIYKNWKFGKEEINSDHINYFFGTNSKNRDCSDFSGTHGHHIV